MKDELEKEIEQAYRKTEIQQSVGLFDSEKHLE